MIVLLLDDSTPLGLIIQLGECSRLVELEFNIVGKFYLIAVPRLIDFHDGHALLACTLVAIGAGTNVVGTAASLQSI